MLNRQKTKAARAKPKRPVGRVLQSVRQVLRISHVEEKEAVWQWGQPTLAALPTTFDIAVWNIWKGSGGDLFLGEYTNLVKGRHLLLLQEVLLTLKALGNFAPKGFSASHGATYRRRDGLRDGVMTISAAAPIETAIRVLCHSPEPLLKTTKATLVSWFKIEGYEKSLCVVNTHSTLVRRPATAVREIEKVLKKIRDHDGPILYAGDFNTFSKTYIREVDKVMSTIGLKRVVLEADPRTATTALDQIYVRQINVLSAKVETSYRHSDHFPITATLEILA
jgi:endonuclease/exonuclease/phosphatase (EEP) superfamily protein YafD